MKIGTIYRSLANFTQYNSRWQTRGRVQDKLIMDIYTVALPPFSCNENITNIFYINITEAVIDRGE